MNGSSDFISLDYFLNAIKNYTSNSSPQIYGLSGFSSDGLVILNNKFENRFYLINRDCLSNNPNKNASRGVLGVKFLGGILGMNKHLLKKINNKIILPSGNEYELEQYL